jgi:hypothetical protein
VRSRGKGWCCNKSMSLECCKHDSDLRTTVGIQSRMGKGEETHLAEEFVVVRSTHSVSSRANVLRRHSSCRNCGRSPLPNRQVLDSSKKANTPRAVPGSSACVNLSGRVIDSSSLVSGMRRSSSMILSMNMTNWRSVAAAVDDTTAVQHGETSSSSSRSIRLQPVSLRTQTTSTARTMQSTSRPRGDSCGRVRNQICSRAGHSWSDDIVETSMAALISGLTTCLITVSLVGKKTRFRPRTSTCRHFRQICYC